MLYQNCSALVAAAYRARRRHISTVDSGRI